jgi:hypothetical protein
MNGIVHKSFDHGWFYHYYLHTNKAKSLCEKYPSLLSFLHGIFENCPRENFLKGPRGSKTRIDIAIPTTRISHHEVCSLAKEGLSSSRFKTAHLNVQMGMLQHDSKTIGIEVPLWLDENEIPKIHDLLGNSGPLSGHIDALRIEDGLIWIWDYKPRANKEKYATLQTWLYAIMLSHRTGVPLAQFRCGYFDEQEAFLFSPPPLESVALAPLVEMTSKS